MDAGENVSAPQLVNAIMHVGLDYYLQVGEVRSCHRPNNNTQWDFSPKMATPKRLMRWDHFYRIQGHRLGDSSTDAKYPKGTSQDSRSRV